MSMSMHKELKSKQEVEGLLLHGLSVAKPCQLSDAFILGMRFELNYHDANQETIAKQAEEIERLRGQLADLQPIASQAYQWKDAHGDVMVKHKQQAERIKELEEMLGRFTPSNDYQEPDEDGELCDVNYGGCFEYNEDSEEMGLEVIKLLEQK